MVEQRQATKIAPVGPTVRSLIPSFSRSLAAANKSPRTITVYVTAARSLADYLEASGMPMTIDGVRREHIESYVVSLAERFSAASVSVYYRALQAFFKWTLTEDEITVSPMARMTPPIVPEKPVPVLSEDALRRLLRACEGKGFRERRDTAILRLLIDTGLRRGELAGLDVDDVDLDQRVAHVVGS
jgi:site-specific recombinase XerD